MLKSIEQQIKDSLKADRLLLSGVSITTTYKVVYNIDLQKVEEKVSRLDKEENKCNDNSRR